MIYIRLFSLVVSFLIHIHATYPHNPYYYTLGFHLSYPRLPSLPIPADLPSSVAESALLRRQWPLPPPTGQSVTLGLSFATYLRFSSVWRRYPAPCAGAPLYPALELTLAQC